MQLEDVFDTEEIDHTVQLYSRMEFGFEITQKNPCDSHSFRL